MTKERAWQIEREVFEYANYFEDMNIDRCAIYRIGVVIGRMKGALHDELMKEIDNEKSEEQA